MNSAAFKLKPPVIDLQSPRVQLACGLAMAVLNCAASDYQHLGTIYFALHVALTIIVALISFEITGLYSNRLGAMPAVWSAFILSCYGAVGSTAVPFRYLDGISLPVLLVFFLYQRFRRLHEKSYLAVAAALFAVTLSISPVMALSLPPAFLLYEFLFRSSPCYMYPVEPDEELPIISPVTVALRMFLFAGSWLAISITAQMGTEIAVGKIWFSNFALLTAIFCLFIPLLLLPITGASTKRQTQTFAAIILVLFVWLAFSIHVCRQTLF